MFGLGGQKLAFKPLANLAGLVGASKVVRITAGPTGDLVVLTLDGPVDARTKTDHPQTYTVFSAAGGVWRHLQLEPTKDNLLIVQPLPEDRWLLIRLRCGGPDDKNGLVYGSDGRVAKSFHVGDGIQDVQTTARGEIWISYFDEGVFGNTALGQQGLVCLEETGEPRFKYHEADAEVLPSIADCYALNVVSEDDVWICPYTDFPLVAIRGKRVGPVHMGLGIEGAHAFAVHDHRVLFCGGYDSRSALTLVDLNTKKKVPITATDDAGRRQEFSDLFARGSRVYGLLRNQPYGADIKDMAR